MTSSTVYRKFSHTLLISPVICPFSLFPTKGMASDGYCRGYVSFLLYLELAQRRIPSSAISDLLNKLFCKLLTDYGYYIFYKENFSLLPQSNYMCGSFTVRKYRDTILRELCGHLGLSYNEPIHQFFIIATPQPLY